MPPDLSFSRENLSFDFKDTDMKRLSMEIEKEKWVSDLTLLMLPDVLGHSEFTFCMQVFLIAVFSDLIVHQQKGLMNIPFRGI